jgi:prepilin-type N-terminal cleavage/methylation domain-containing protein
MRTCPTSRRRRGFTLLEVVIAFVLLSSMTVMTLTVMSGSSQRVNETLTVDSLRSEAAAALHRIAQDMRNAERGVVFTATTQLQLQKATGWSSGAQQWDPNPHVYRVLNGNLIIDHIPGLEPEVLAHDVTSFVVSPVDATTPNTLTLLGVNAANVTVTITLSRRLGLNADNTERTVTVTESRTLFVRATLD